MPNFNIANRVVVYAWLSRIDGGQDVGHVALYIEKSKRYVSLYPDLSLKGRTDHTVYKIVWRKIHEDFYDKGNFTPPQFTCCLYGLDPVAIEKKCEEYMGKINREGDLTSEGKVKTWSLFGNFRLFKDMAGSCSSVLYDLLVAGGLRELTSIGITVPYMPSPHNILTLARSAKDYEIKQDNRTLDFDSQYSFEYRPCLEVKDNAVMQLVSSSCAIQ